MSRIDWFGDKIRARLQRAAAAGVNKTMGEAVVRAKGHHGFTNRTTTAEKSIRITTPARASKGPISGTWGSISTNYFKYLEFGTELTRGRTSIRQRAGGASTGLRKPARNAAALPWNGGSFTPTLGPAALIAYPRLAANIKEAHARA